MSDPSQAPVMPRCYRHPNQFAGVVCQRCDRPICPQCMQTASVGFHCPECVKQGGQKVYQGPAALQPAQPVVTQVLIGINVAAYLLGAALSHGSGLANSNNSFETYGSLFGPAVVHHPWILVTSAFLHDGPIHIGFNMYALWVLGRSLEPVVGRLRFSLLYGAAMLAGSLGVVIASPLNLSLGASGAIFGLLGALLVIARRNHAMQAVRSLVVVLGINLLITFAIPGISIADHIGGVIGGALCCVLMLEAQDRSRSKQAGVLVVCALAAVFAIAAYIIARLHYGADPLYQI